MIIFLIYSGIVSIPFFVIPGVDSRIPKELLGLGLALSVVLAALFNGQFKPFRNYWLLGFILFSYICIIISPMFAQFKISFLHDGKLTLLMDRPAANLWMFKALFYLTIYVMAMIAVASFDFSCHQLRNTIFLMALCGFLMSLYLFIQKLGIDPIFNKIHPSINPDVNFLKAPLLGGFMGQSTVVSPFIAMTIPLAFYLKRYAWVVCMIVAVTLTLSKVAIAAMIIGLAFYLICSSKKFRILIATVFIISAIASGLLYVNHKHLGSPQKISNEFVNMASGRTTAWSAIVKDLTSDFEGSKRMVLGMGPGSFRETFTVFNNSKFDKAHNDPLEGLFNFGIAGMSLILLAFGFQVRKIMPMNQIRHRTVEAICASLVILLLTSLGTFSLQIMPNIFYAIILIGLLNNEKLMERHYAQT